MNQRIRQIVEEARRLSPADRHALLEMLQAEFGDDLHEGSAEEVEVAWQQEIEDRIAAAERGEFGSVDFDTVVSRAKALVRGT